MDSKIPISEIFETIQGEGRYTGIPCLFIRVAGCNLNCSFCDTKYSIYKNQGKEMTVDSLIKKVLEYKGKIIVWSGGEPMLYFNQIYEVVRRTFIRKDHHLETNGTILADDMDEFEYVAFSPKSEIDAKRIKNFVGDTEEEYYDIKVVTDLDTVGVKMLEYATMLMPLSTDWPWSEDDREVKQKVWKYCVKHNLKFSPRLHCEVFGKERGV